MNVTRGMRSGLDNLFALNQEVKIKIQIAGSAVYDFTCFGVDSENKLSDDRYMIFYNQTKSPNGEIQYNKISSGAEFSIKLNSLPNNIQKLVFTASIDGKGSMGEISSHTFSIEQGNREKVIAQFSGKDFSQEKAITSFEIYRKNGWRFNVIAKGFNGGLDSLLEFYGGENSDKKEVKPIPPPVVQSQIQSAVKPQIRPEIKPIIKQEEPIVKISLEKKIQANAPKLISLVKPLVIELKKRNLENTTSRVGLVLDISGSMDRSYKNGTVQEIVNKILPIAVQFDDDGELDFWYYAEKSQQRPSINMKNYESAVPKDWEDLMDSLGYINNEPVVMEKIIKEYENSKIPAYVIFVTDGGIYEETKIKHLLIRSSKLPIFWQFVGVSGTDYGILEQLDNMKGRYIDNANFFALDDFRSVPNSALYSRLLNEFPSWLKEAKEKNIF